jgi:hypothetical protein
MGQRQTANGTGGIEGTTHITCTDGSTIDHITTMVCARGAATHSAAADRRGKCVPQTRAAERHACMRGTLACMHAPGKGRDGEAPAQGDMNSWPKGGAGMPSCDPRLTVQAKIPARRLMTRMSAVCSSLSSGCEGELFLCVFLQTAPLSLLPPSF